MNGFGSGTLARKSNQDAEKGESSDSFKRAAVKWGVGRFLYSKKLVKVSANEKKTNGNYPYPVDNGKKIYDLTKYINDLQNNQKSVNQGWQQKNKGIQIIKKEIPSLDHQKEKALNYWNMYIDDAKTIANLDNLFVKITSTYPGFKRR